MDFLFDLSDAVFLKALLLLLRSLDKLLPNPRDNDLALSRLLSRVQAFSTQACGIKQMQGLVMILTQT